MKENKYDDLEFFNRYSRMPRSIAGLAGAGEWHAFRRLFPDLDGNRARNAGRAAAAHDAPGRGEEGVNVFS